MVRLVLLLVSGVFLALSCTDDLGLARRTFSCEGPGDCLSGWTCDGGVCVLASSVPDSSTDTSPETSDDCPTNTADCNDNPADGCEVDLLTDDLHCGACGNVCTASRTSCFRGVCGCPAWPEGGYGDCNNDLSDGCEKPLFEDDENCGACNNVCAPPERCVDGFCMEQDVDPQRILVQIGLPSLFLDPGGDVPLAFDQPVAAGDVVVRVWGELSGDLVSRVGPGPDSLTVLVGLEAPIAGERLTVIVTAPALYQQELWVRTEPSSPTSGADFLPVTPTLHALDGDGNPQPLDFTTGDLSSSPGMALFDIDGDQRVDILREVVTLEPRSHLAFLHGADGVFTSSGVEVSGSHSVGAEHRLDVGAFRDQPEGAGLVLSALDSTTSGFAITFFDGASFEDWVMHPYLPPFQVVDVDHDGLMDLSTLDGVVRTASTDFGTSFSMMLSAGGGTVLEGLSGRRVLTDINRDGALDAVFADQILSNIGVPPDVDLRPVENSRLGYVPQLAADLNSDTLPDILVFPSDGGPVFSAIQTGDANVWRLRDFASDALLIDVGDVDGDDDLDLLVVNSLEEADLILVAFNEDGEFHRRQALPLPLPMNFDLAAPERIGEGRARFADLNNDGHLDVVVALPEQDVLVWLQDAP